MRKVVYSINLSIDGCCDHTSFNPDEELFPYFTAQIENADQVVYGRVTYELMFPYWAEVARDQSESKVVNDFAEKLTAVNKLVFSHTLASVEGNARIARGSLAEEIQKLKQQPGGNILIGGVDLPSQLIALGMVDEFYFVIHPGIVGSGRHLMEEIPFPETLNLKLVEVKQFKSGCLGVHYTR